MKTALLRSTMLAAGLALLVLAGCQPPPPTPTPTLPAVVAAVASPTLSAPSTTPTAAPSPSATRAASPSATPAPAKPAATATAPATAVALPRRPAGFAAVRPVESTATPQVKPYTVAADLSNVDMHRAMAFSPEARALLARNAFVVTPGNDREFFHLYERIGYQQVPVFITTDSVLHIYHLLFDKVLRDVERESLAPALSALTESMLAAAQAQLDGLQGTTLESAARRNLAYFAVANRLLNPGAAIPPAVKDLAEAELKLIEAHAGIASSPLFGYREDYSQYVPRGHYTRSNLLKAYFKAAMWYGRMTFLADPNSAAALDQTRSALLIVSALNAADGGSALKAWSKVYDTTAFFVGVSDDLTYYEYAELAQAVFGNVTPAGLLADDAKLASFAARAYNLRPPEINSMVRDDADDPATPRGYRFLGQRFVLDAAIFQRLVAPAVSARMLPKALDVPAPLGSQEALAILEAAGETKADGYVARMGELRTRIAAIARPTWTQNLYWSWLHTLRPLLQVRGEGYPTFMRNPAWVRKDLNTFLGSWTELKHDTILYAKQVYAERGDDTGRPPQGYVEPNPELYARLLGLAQTTRRGLIERNLLIPDDDKLLGNLESLLEWLKLAAEKELAGQALSADDNRRIEEYGATLEKLTLAAADPEDPGAMPGRTYIEELQAAIVADVATDAVGGRVLEEGIGRIYSIFVVVPTGDRLQVNWGGVFSYYEFAEPLENRLTDEAWRERLEKGPEPALPAWTAPYRAPTVPPTPTPTRPARQP